MTLLQAIGEQVDMAEVAESGVTAGIARWSKEASLTADRLLGGRSTHYPESKIIVPDAGIELAAHG